VKWWGTITENNGGKESGEGVRCPIGFTPTLRSIQTCSLVLVNWPIHYLVPSSGVGMQSCRTRFCFSAFSQAASGTYHEHHVRHTALSVQECVGDVSVHSCWLSGAKAPKEWRKMRLRGFIIPESERPLVQCALVVLHCNWGQGMFQGPCPSHYPPQTRAEVRKTMGATGPCA